MDYSTLTDQQKSELLAYHLDIIRRLRSSMLRSDWHAALEAALHYTILGFEDVYRLLVKPFEIIRLANQMMGLGRYQVPLP